MPALYSTKSSRHHEGQPKNHCHHGALATYYRPDPKGNFLQVSNLPGLIHSWDVPSRPNSATAFSLGKVTLRQESAMTVIGVGCF